MGFTGDSKEFILKQNGKLRNSIYLILIVSAVTLWYAFDSHRAVNKQRILDEQTASQIVGALQIYFDDRLAKAIHVAHPEISTKQISTEFSPDTIELKRKIIEQIYKKGDLK